ncbi:MAG: fused response regulator/phosphatase [Desulfobacteraceae bacterium]
MKTAEKKKFTILVVDDNLLNLKMIQHSLTREGYHVVTAENGPDAREAALENRPDLILLDIEMPKENGFEVIRKLKENPATGSIPVIFLTGLHQVDAKLKGFDLGAVDYITKPFHPLEVLARVRIHLKLSIAVNSLIANQAEKLRQITEAQTSMLPVPEDYDNPKFGVYYRTFQEAGGDFYDILSISDDITGYFAADFSGHDIKTSYMTASVKALLAQNCTPVYSPLESMKMINDVLSEILPAGKYLTASYVHLNRNTGKLILVNAGHPPVVYVPCKGEAELLKNDGDVLGMFKDAQFGLTQKKVHPGDRFYLYTDGLVESSEKKITWTRGSESLLQLFSHNNHTDIQKAPRQLIKKLFNDKFIPEDDILILGVEV